MKTNAEKVRPILRMIEKMLRDCPPERDLILAGNIGAEVTTQGVRAALEAPGPVRVVLRSEGGELGHARGIAALLAAHPGAWVHTELAASAAVLVAVSTPWRTVAPGARIMLHRSVSVVAGTHETLAAASRRLAEIDAAMFADIARPTRTTADQLEAMFDDSGELWLDHDDAFRLGFAYSIEGTPVHVARSAADDPSRAEKLLRERLALMTDDAALRANGEGRAAVAALVPELGAAHAESAAALDAAIESSGLEAVTARTEEALRRHVEIYRSGLIGARRQRRVRGLRGIPELAPPVSWTCPAGHINFHHPGDANQLARCFTCHKEDSK